MLSATTSSNDAASPTTRWPQSTTIASISIASNASSSTMSTLRVVAEVAT